MAGWDDIPNETQAKSGWDAIPDERFESGKQVSVIPPSYLEKTISAFPSSAYEYGKSMVSAVTSPIQTGKAIGKTALGAAELLIPGEQGEEQYAEAFGGLLKERYGGLENIKKTISEDPVGFLADFSTFLTGIGGVAGKIGPIAKIGKTVSKVGKAVEPLSIAGKGVGLMAKPVKGAVTGVVGITTGRGKGSIEEAMKGTESFRKSMRGAISAEEIVGEAKGGLHVIAKERGDIYRGRLAQIENMPNPPKMDILPIKSRFQTLLDDFGIEVTSKGELNFNHSTLKGDPKAIGEVKNIKEIIDDWGMKQVTSGGQPSQLLNQFGQPMPPTPTITKIVTNKWETSPIGFDTLKRQLDNFYSETSHGRKIVADLRGKVKEELVNKVSGYAEMTKDYEKTTKVIQEIERALSLKDKSSIDTAFRKLNAAIREDNAFRRNLVDMVEKGSGTDISSMIAGRGMTGYMPTSWMGRSFSIGAFFSSLLGKPEIAPIMAIASPRIMGEFFNLLGRGAEVSKKIKATGILSAPVRQTLFQAGRVPETQIGLMP